MTLFHLPAFSDNYIWVLHDGQRALVVDPGESDGVLAWLADQRLDLDTILITHHHADHTGGVGAGRGGEPGAGPHGRPHRLLRPRRGRPAPGLLRRHPVLGGLRPAVRG